MSKVKVTMNSEMISIEQAKIARDKRGGHFVKLARSTIRGRNASTVWKELRFLDGKFENWPKRWAAELLPKLTVQTLRLVEDNAQKLSAGETVHARPQDVSGGDYLMRDIHALDAQGR